ncbi:MAG: hypothetical protein QM820_54180 [Minicystis sp.]
MNRSLRAARPAPLLVVLCLAAAACGAEVETSAVSDLSGAEAAAEPPTSCDDDNPCTADANCTPCSALPEALWDIHHCTSEDELPPFCAGRTGCVHVPLTTPAAQINDCFPVAGDPDLHAGACLAGVCVENDC